MEWKWGKKKEDEDEEEGSKNGPRESQKEGTLLSISCENSCF